MLATLVIGLREGLEASLIVGIIAAFLRRTGRPLRPMWIGVGIAVALSIAVGVALQLVSAALPQAQQEGMESIIGLVAVAIVTGMIGWMNLHARNMRSELEAQAASAVKDGAAWALVGMAFLAVLKEGFETSVFLLAAFQSSGNVFVSSAGAVIGIAIAVGIGIGIFRGGVHLNLGRFFKITGIFLVFIAAGLVLTALRTAHEAGWILIGQQTTVSLAWLAPAGTVQAALLTGVLGIPADPRLIEILGWLAYLIPTLTYLLWPAKRRPSARALPRMRFIIAGVLAAAAAILAVSVALPGAYQPTGAAPITGANATGSARITSTGSGDAKKYILSTVIAGDAVETSLAAKAGASTVHDGLPALAWAKSTTGALNRPATLTLDQLVQLAGGRLPIGMSASQNPGPFDAKWTNVTRNAVWVANGSLLDASRTSTDILTLSGGGLLTTRTLTPSVDTNDPSSNWHVTTAYRDAFIAGAAAVATQTSELLLWKLWIPLVLAAAALVLCGYGLKARLNFRGKKSQQNTVTKETYA
jgi:high-affinity iron transporter